VSYFDQFKSIFVSKAPQRYYAAIKSDNVDPPDTELVFETGKTYLKILLCDMYLEKRRILYKTSTPVVHAYCSFLHDGQPEQIPIIVGSSQIKELNNLNDIIKLNFRIFGPTPFDGGAVELLVALFAVETEDYGNKFLEVLSSLSVLTGVGELNTSAVLLKPLKDGIEGLFGLNKYVPHIGVHDTFSLDEGCPSPLTSGYRVVINTSEASMKGKELWVKGGRLMSGPTLGKAQPFTDADYLLFKIQPLAARDDWKALDSIKETWDKTTQEAAKSGNKDVESAFTAFRGAVINSPDLIWSDKVRLVDAMKNRLDEISTMKEPPRAIRRAGVELTPEQRNEELYKEMENSLSKAISIEEAKNVKNIPKNLK